MLGSGHLLSGLDIATGTFALMVFSVGAALVILVVLARFVFRRAGQSGRSATDLRAPPVGVRPMQIRTAAIPRE